MALIDDGDWPQVLALVKLQARVDNDAEDDLIKGFVQAALTHVEQHCDIVLVKASPTAPEEVALSPDIWQAVYLIVAHWYANREEVVTGTIATSLPMAAERLLWYRKRF
nr:head-tail connector protein [Pseudomonas tohonis]